MNAPQVSFQVRIRSTAGLDEIAGRVRAALGCDFAPVEHDREFDPGQAVEAATLGLVVHLIGDGDGDVDPGSEVTYVLRGLTRPDVEAELDIGVPVISITDFVLAVLQVLDDPEWYVADRDELLAEAGLAD